jgi:hypothetical protein
MGNLLRCSYGVTKKIRLSIFSEPSITLRDITSILKSPNDCFRMVKECLISPGTGPKSIKGIILKCETHALLLFSQKVRLELAKGSLSGRITSYIHIANISEFSSIQRFFMSCSIVYEGAVILILDHTWLSIKKGFSNVATCIIDTQNCVP